MDMMYCKEVAEVIFKQLFISIDKWVFFSWGMRVQSCAYYNGMPTLQMLVSGAVHKGWVFISLNEGTDSYEVRLLDNDKKSVLQTHTDIFCDNLGSFVDSLVERPSNLSDDEYKELADADTQAKLAEEMAIFNGDD